MMVFEVSCVALPSVPASHQSPHLDASFHLSVKYLPPLAAGSPRLITCSGRPRRIPTTPASARTGTARPAASSTSQAVSSGIYTLLLSIHYLHSIYPYLHSKYTLST